MVEPAQDEQPPRGDEWQAALARTVGRQVKRFREARKMTAQQLSDHLYERYGFKMRRTVIGNLESGHRQVVDLAEVVLIARVLDIPPLVLVAPLNEPSFEVLPGVSVNPWVAARWITGEAGPPGDNERAEGDESLIGRKGLLATYRVHDNAIERWQRAFDAVAMTDPEFRGEVLVEDGRPAREFMAITADYLPVLRQAIRAQGATPPPLPPQLQHLDEAGVADA